MRVIIENILMRLLLFVVIDPYRLDDGTLMRGWMNGSIFEVDIVGTESSVIEIAEQLAWLGAALCTSPYEHGIALCTPFFRRTELMDEQLSDSGIKPPIPKSDMTFEIGFPSNLSLSRQKIQMVTAGKICS